tara:strand:- start:1355 stop:1564 length:210 start_codon:yes stop_codon:yes gene_type:complete
MSDLRTEWQQKYANILAKLGETELIIQIHKEVKTKLLQDAENARSMIASISAPDPGSNGLPEEKIEEPA